MNNDNEKPYTAVVNMRGILGTQEYRDWFTSDEAAIAGYTEILAEQGYTVERVEIGNPCTIYIL